MTKYTIYAVSRSSLQNEDYMNFHDITSLQSGMMGANGSLELLIMFLDRINSEGIDKNMLYFLADNVKQTLIKLD